MDATQSTAPSACTSPGADAGPSQATPAAGVQTEQAVVVVAADWPTTAYVPGRYLLASVPGTADLLVAGRPVTVGLHWDGGGTERPYVADYTDGVTLDECDAIDRAVSQAWDAHGREAA